MSTPSHASAANFNAPLDLRGQLQALGRYLRSMIVIMVLAVGAAVGASFVMTPVYESDLTFFAATPTDQNGTALQSDQFAQQRINSYVGVLKSERLAELVISDTGVDLTPAQLTNMITATVDPDTVLLSVSVRDTSQTRVQSIARSIADNFDGLISELDGKGTSAQVQLRVISGPTLAPGPVSPRPVLNLGVGILVGFVAAVGQALVRQQLDATFRSSDDLTSRTALPNLAVLNADRSARSQPVMIPTAEHSRRAEAFRQLRTSLRFADVTSPVEILAVTSSVESEGKTTTAANLAVSFAETGRRVLLVDADLRKPKLETYLGLEPAAGLTTVLLGDANVADVVQPWSNWGLEVLASGPIPPNPSELLGSTTMEKALTEFRGAYDLVIIDTPPLLPVTDAAVVASLVDGVLVAVRHGHTRREQLARSLTALRRVDARVLGTVLTFTPVTRHDRLPSYYVDHGRR